MRFFSTNITTLTLLQQISSNVMYTHMRAHTWVRERERQTPTHTHTREETLDSLDHMTTHAHTYETHESTSMRAHICKHPFESARAREHTHRHLRGHMWEQVRARFREWQLAYESTPTWHTHTHTSNTVPAAKCAFQGLRTAATGHLHLDVTNV